MSVLSLLVLAASGQSSGGSLTGEPVVDFVVPLVLGSALTVVIDAGLRHMIDQARSGFHGMYVGVDHLKNRACFLDLRLGQGVLVVGDSSFKLGKWISPRSPHTIADVYCFLNQTVSGRCRLEPRPDDYNLPRLILKLEQDGAETYIDFAPTH